MVDLTPNFNPKPSGVRIEIYDEADVLQYTFETSNVKAKKPIYAASLNGHTDDLMTGKLGNWIGTEKYNKGLTDIEQSAEFDGTNHVESGDETRFDGLTKDTPHSMFCRFKPKTGLLQNRIIMGKGGNIAQAGITLFYNNGGSQGTLDRVIIYLIDGVGVNYNVGSVSGSIKMNQWNHIGYTYEGIDNRDGLDIYVDKVGNGASSLGGSADWITNKDLCVGAADGLVTPINADSQVANATVYDFKLTQTQIDALFGSESPYGFVPSTDAVVQDFKLTDLSLAIGGNDNYGTAELLIEDILGNLIDSTDRKKCLIKPEWRIKIYFGKDAAGLERWFSGVVKDSDVIRPQTNDQRISLACVGSGVILKERITIMKVNQDKENDGEELDNTDTKTRLDNLIFKLINDPSQQIDDNIPLLTEIKMITGRFGVCTECLDIKIANVNELFTSYSSFISRIAGIANIDWYVNPDNHLVMRDGVSHSSGVLCTNKLTGAVAQGWNPKRIAYIKNSPFSWKDTSIDGMYGWIHGAGHFAPVIEINNNQTPDATDDFIGEWLAVPINISRDNIFKIALRLSKVEDAGPINTNTEVRIVGGDGSGKFAQGSVDLADIGSGDSLDTLTVDGVEILGTPITFSGSARATAFTIAGKINDHVSEPDYIAFVNDDKKIKIEARFQSDIPNNFVVTGTDTGFTPVYVNMGDEEKGITGRPNFNDIRRSIKLQKTTLQNLGTSTPAPWFEIPLTPKLQLSPSEQVWMLMPNFGFDSGGDDTTLHFDYKTGEGKYFQSTDGFNWFEVTGLVSLRVWSARRLITTVENTVITQKFPDKVREKLLPIRADLEEQSVRLALVQAVHILGQERRFYSDMEISMPERRIDIASYCRTEDELTGLSVKAKITGYEIELHSEDVSRGGCRSVKLTLDEVHGA